MKKQHFFKQALIHWRSDSEVSFASILWFITMLGAMAGLDFLAGGSTLHRTIWLVPPFAATLSILVLLPSASIAQPIPVVAGSTLGATLGAGAALAVHGPFFAVIVAGMTLVMLSVLRLYHPPAVALSMYPLLLHPGILFPWAVVFPFTLAAVGSAAALSRRIKSWPAYPRKFPAPAGPGESEAVN
jgi:CBS domain-containing membrane protein